MEHFIQKKEEIFTDFRSLPLLKKCRHAVRSNLMSLPFHLKSHTLKFSEVPQSWPGINHLAAGFFQPLCNPQIGHWGLFWTASGFCWHQYTLFSTTSETLSYVNLSGEKILNMMIFLGLPDARQEAEIWDESSQKNPESFLQWDFLIQTGDNSISCHDFQLFSCPGSVQRDFR